MWGIHVSAPCVEMEECVRRLAEWRPASVLQALAITVELARMSFVTPAETCVMVGRVPSLCSSFCYRPAGHEWRILEPLHNDSVSC